MFEDFARALDRAAAGEEPDVDQRPPGALSLLVETVIERIRNRLTNRTRRRSRRPRR